MIKAVLLPEGCQQLAAGWLAVPGPNLFGVPPLRFPNKRTGHCCSPAAGSNSSL